MADKSWLRRRIEKVSAQGALTRAYKTVRVDPDRFLLELRAGAWPSGHQLSGDVFG